MSVRSPRTRTRTRTRARDHERGRAHERVVLLTPQTTTTATTGGGGATRERAHNHAATRHSDTATRRRRRAQAEGMLGALIGAFLGNGRHVATLARFGKERRARDCHGNEVTCASRAIAFRAGPTRPDPARLEHKKAGAKGGVWGPPFVRSARARRAGPPADVDGAARLRALCAVARRPRRRGGGGDAVLFPVFFQVKKRCIRRPSSVAPPPRSLSVRSSFSLFSFFFCGGAPVRRRSLRGPADAHVPLTHAHAPARDRRVRASSPTSHITNAGRPGWPRRLRRLTRAATAVITAHATVCRRTL